MPKLADGRLSLERVTFTGCCPACGNASVFTGLLAMRANCPACGLDIAAREQGDGPAFFGIVIIGTLATMGAAIVEIIYSPPYWVHAALWIPFIILGSLITLRFAKACMLALQFIAKPEDFK